MEASTNNTKNTTANVLVYEPVPPIKPSNKEGQVSTNPINPSGSLAEQAGPGLSTRQVQPIYALFDKYKSEAHQLLKEGKITEASEIYISLAENLELKLKKRLNYAKKLVEINAQALQTTQTKEYIGKAADILADIAKDDRVYGPSRLKAFRSIAETKGLEERALEIFSTLFKSQVLSDWIPDALRNCVVPILLSRVKDLTLFPTDRIKAAEELSTLVGEERQGEVWSALLNERLTYIHPNYGMKVAEKLGKIPAYRACAAGYLLYLGRMIKNYIPWSIQAFEKLSKIPGYEATAAECLLFLHQRFQDNSNHYDNKVYFNQWETAEALSAIPGQEGNAATVLVNITKGPLSWMLCFHHTGERLSKIPGQEAKSKEAWDYIASYEGDHHSHPSMVSSRIIGMRALFDLCGEKDKAAKLLTKLAEDQQETIEHRILAVDNLARIPGKEAEAAQLKSDLEATLQDTKCKIALAKNDLQIPDKKQKAAESLVQIAKDPTLTSYDRMLAGDILSAVPEQAPKAIEAWLAINACPKLIRHKKILAAEKLSHLPGQAQRARELVDQYLIEISDADAYFLV